LPCTFFAGSEIWHPDCSFAAAQNGELDTHSVSHKSPFSGKLKHLIVSFLSKPVIVFESQMSLEGIKVGPKDYNYKRGLQAIIPFSLRIDYSCTCLSS